MPLAIEALGNSLPFTSWPFSHLYKRRDLRSSRTDEHCSLAEYFVTSLDASRLIDNRVMGCSVDAMKSVTKEIVEGKVNGFVGSLNIFESFSKQLLCGCCFGKCWGGTIAHLSYSRSWMTTLPSKSLAYSHLFQRR